VGAVVSAIERNRIIKGVCDDCAGTGSAECTDQSRGNATALVLVSLDPVEMAQEVTQTDGLL
jgi:hypothetical protein